GGSLTESDRRCFEQVIRQQFVDSSLVPMLNAKLALSAKLRAPRALEWCCRVVGDVSVEAPCSWCSTHATQLNLVASFTRTLFTKSFSSLNSSSSLMFLAPMYRCTQMPA